MTHPVRPAVGVAVIITRGKEVLLGRRKGAHGSGTWAFPGGHLEFGESILDCARREVAEETGLSVSKIRHAAFTNDIFEDENKHYATLFVLAGEVSGRPRVMEPDKCHEWQWFEWGALPSPIFLSLQNLVTQGYSPF